MDFATRLNLLMEEKKITQKALADHLGITRQAVAQYLAGNTRPNIDILVKIAQFFSVSADYLLGLSPLQTQNVSMQEMCKQLGLSEWSLETLEEATQNRDDDLLCFLDEIIRNLPYSYLLQEYTVIRQIREKGIENQMNDTRGSAFEQDKEGHWWVSMFGGTAAKFLAQEIGKEICEWLLDTQSWEEQLRDAEEKVEWLRILSNNSNNKEE